MRSAPACLIEGFRLLARPGLRRFVILPALGNILIFVLASILLFLALDNALDRWLPEGADWLRWLLFPLVAFALFAGGLFLFAVLANALLGPFLGKLAAEVLQSIGGTVPTTVERGFWIELRADIGLELRRLGYVLACLAAVFVLSWIPLLQLAAAPLGLAVGAWLLSVEYSAHPLGLRKSTLRQQLGILRQHRASTLLFGLSSMGVLLIPLVNLLVVPASVAGMTLFLHERGALADATPE